MTGLDSVEIKKAIIHKVGNPTRGEQLHLSANELSLNDIIVRDLLKKYFLKPFNENEQYFFSHLSDVALNEVYSYVSAIFENHKSFQKYAALLAQFLYTKSTHVKIKEGELYVVLFENVPFGTEYIEAVGIFKSESTETFLKVFQHGKGIEVGAEDGININKLDKGCIVFNKNKADGYVVCVVDNLNKQQDTQYWMDDFLQVKPYADSYHHTNNVLSMCKLFIANDLQEKFEIGKAEQIDMLNRSMEYFKTKEQFKLDEFAEEVIHHPEVVEAFNDYRNTWQNSKQVNIEDEFDIHLAAVKKQERSYKSVLKLDKNFHIYIHGRRDLIEKGYDELTGRHFYKIYFDEEA